ncbi:hypothetical protein DVDV_1784 [Desulfovibrio sp. DV]|nr:hypothetical protein DVDV_1784 [Desulfovibrio sp. DV]
MNKTTLKRINVNKKLKMTAGLMWNKSMAGGKQKPGQGPARYSRM